MYVILTLPYMIRDIACSERRQINAAIRSAPQGDPLHGAPLIEDPCEKIVETLLDLLRRFLLIRRQELLTNEIVECIERGTKMMESLMEKGGKESGWKFGKFHGVKHLPLWIILFGWVEIFCGQPGERWHKELLKDVFSQYLGYWERVARRLRSCFRIMSDYSLL